MSKKQVQEQVLNPGQLTDTTTAKQVRNRTVNQREKTGAELTVTEQTEQVRNTNRDFPLTDPKGPTSGAKTAQKSRGQVRTGTNTRTCAKVGKTPEKMAKRMGADDQSGAGKIIPISGAEKQVRRQGQRGPDKKPRKIRYDNSPETAVALDDRSRIVRHNLELFNLGTLKDKNDEIEVQERIQAYFEICAKNSVMPTVAGFAMSLGVDRATLWDWMDGRRGTIKNPVVVDVLKRIYSMLNTQYEELLTEGKIIPVGAFFLLQNNHGYKNQTDHVVVAQPAEEPDSGEIAARAGLLEDSHD